MEADGPEDQPCEPRGDGHQMPPDAEGAESGEHTAQHDEDLPEVGTPDDCFIECHYGHSQRGKGC